MGRRSGRAHAASFVQTKVVNHMKPGTPILGMVVVCATMAATPSAVAQASFQSSFAAFQGLSTTTLRADFEGLHTEGGIANPYSEGGVTFRDPSNLYLAMPGGAAAVADFDAPVTSNVLTVSGNEDITMTFAGPAPTAIGFTSLTNRFNAPVVTVFDTSNSLIGTYVLTQAPSSVGFVGITSSVGIGSVRWLADRGGIKDSAIDNIYVGVAAVPEPQTYALLLAGLGVTGALARRRATKPSTPRPPSISA